MALGARPSSGLAQDPIGEMNSLRRSPHAYGGISAEDVKIRNYLSLFSDTCFTVSESPVNPPKFIQFFGLGYKMQQTSRVPENGLNRLHQQGPILKNSRAFRERLTRVSVITPSINRQGAEIPEVAISFFFAAFLLLGKWPVR